MVCADTALTCAVRELNETLQGGPDPLWTQLLVPLAVAAVTLFVAWRGVVVAHRSADLTEDALRVARQSDELARQVRRDGIDRERRRERQAFEADLRELVADHRRHIVMPGPDSLAEVADRALRLQLTGEALDSPHASRLIEAITAVMAKGLREERVRTLESRSAAAWHLIKQWVRDPEQFGPDRQPIDEMAAVASRLFDEKFKSL